MGSAENSQTASDDLVVEAEVSPLVRPRGDCQSILLLQTVCSKQILLPLMMGLSKNWCVSLSYSTHE